MMEEESSLLPSTGNPRLVKYERKDTDETPTRDKYQTSSFSRKEEKDDCGKHADNGEKKNESNEDKLNSEGEQYIEYKAENINEISDMGDLTKETDRMVGEMSGEREMEKIDKTNTLEGEERFKGPDGGWGWVVLAGAFVVMLLVSTIGPCFSLVFLPLLLDLGASPSTIFWIFSVFSLIWNLVSPAVGPLTEEFGHRSVAMVGSFLVTLGIIASAFATSTWFLFCCFSLIAGVGAGIVVTISTLIIHVYFHKRRGRANGILMTGTSIGMFMAPYIITYLQDHYTYLGATLILGGILLNTCLAASVFHPVRWHTKRSACHRKDLYLETIQMPQSKTNSEHEHDRRKIHTKSPKLKTSSKTEPNVKSKGLCSLLLRVCRSTILSLKILSSPPALIIALSSSLTFNVYLNFLLMVPLVVQNLHSSQVSALCVSVAGGFNLVCRLVVSALTDCKWFNKRIGYIFGITSIAVTTLAFPFLTSTSWMVVTMGVWGCGLGTFMGLYTLIMIEYMGTKSLPSMFGAASLLNGIGFISLGPLLGLITDRTDSFSVGIWVLAAIEGICIILWLFMPSAVAPSSQQAV